MDYVISYEFIRHRSNVEKRENPSKIALKVESSGTLNYDLQSNYHL